MNEPIILKNSFAMGLVALLQIFAPATIAVVTLYAVFAAYGEPMQQYLHSMALVVGLLALLFSRPSRMLQLQLLPGPSRSRWESWRAGWRCSPSCWRLVT